MGVDQHRRGSYGPRAGGPLVLDCFGFDSVRFVCFVSTPFRFFFSRFVPIRLASVPWIFFFVLARSSSFRFVFAFRYSGLQYCRWGAACFRDTVVFACALVFGSLPPFLLSCLLHSPPTRSFLACFYVLIDFFCFCFLFPGFDKQWGGATASGSPGQSQRRGTGTTATSTATATSTCYFNLLLQL